MIIKGKSANNFAKAVKKSNNSLFNYKNIQNDNLWKLKKLSEALNKEE